MRARVFIISLFFLAPSLRAAEVSWPAKFGKWAASDAPKNVPIPSDPDKPISSILKESGFVSASERTYHDGDRFLQLTLCTFRDSSGAYEAYTFLGAGTAAKDSLNAVVVRGNLVLRIRGNIDGSPNDLKELEAWLQSSSDRIPSPPIVGYLPEKNIYPFTERYALGPIGFRAATTALDRADFAALADQAGFNSGAEAMFARYRTGKDEAVLLLLEYPTPQLAEQHVRHLELALPHSAREAGTPTERKGSLLAIVLSPSSAHYAQSLRNAVNYETQVTWNEPRQTLTDPPWTSVIAQIFIGTGVFMVAAVVLGIAFGGLRVVTKIFFPGKVFDRRERMEILQLGLSGKRIDPSDFY
jgi:hypothetical protein